MTIKKAIQFIDHELSKTLNEYGSWFEVHPELLSYRPETGWNIEQILEHVTLTNQFLLILIRKGKKKAQDLATRTDLGQTVAAYEYNLGRLEEIANHKSFIWIRPEHMEPMGDKTTFEIKRILVEQINECKEILKELSNGEGILYKTTMSVNGLGKLDVYQYIYFLCQHAKRHITQMQKVKEQYFKNKDTRK